MDFEREIKRRVGKLEELNLTFKSLEDQDISRTVKRSLKGPSNGVNMSAMVEKAKGKLKNKIVKQINELITVFDDMYVEMNEMVNNNHSEDNLQFLSEETIVNCSQSLNTNSYELDEKLKAKVFARLLREYGRSVGHNQRSMIQEQKTRKIE